MSQQPRHDDQSGSRRDGRDFCFACARPALVCHCEAIPTIQNQTDVLILQHRRERKHRFNSVRILARALSRCEVRVGYTPEFAGHRVELGDRVGLLYPDRQATPLIDLAREALPKQLVLLDGTWHHAKTFVRDIPWLRGLPRYHLTPRAPGRYRIRREPLPFSMSTLEAAAQSLQLLEPQTLGFDQLLAAFDRMVENQLAHAHQQRNWRRKRRRKDTPLGPG